MWLLTHPYSLQGQRNMSKITPCIDFQSDLGCVSISADQIFVFGGGAPDFFQNIFQHMAPRPFSYIIIEAEGALWPHQYQ